MTNDPVSPWWTPQKHADRRPILIARNRIELAARTYFAEHDFLVVDPPGLQLSPGNETHLHAFATTMIGNDGVGETMYLHTSPEFSMKKLLAAGERRIASIGHVWRNRERSALHHPEFTMLEWYRVEESYDAVIEDCVALCRMAARVAGATRGAFCSARDTSDLETPARAATSRIVGWAIGPVRRAAPAVSEALADVTRRGAGMPPRSR